MNTQNETLKKGMKFEVSANPVVTIEVFKKHGTKFMVTVKDETVEPYAVGGVIMSKADIIKHKQTEKVGAEKYTKISNSERNVLNAIAERTANDGSVKAVEVAVDGLNQFQIAGHLSILERKHLIEKTAGKGGKTFIINKNGLNLIETIRSL